MSPREGSRVWEEMCNWAWPSQGVGGLVPWNLTSFPALPGEICGFRIHGSGVPFEAVILDKATGEGLIRAKELVDCEAQKEHTFTIQAYDCGEGPDGTNTKKSHK